MPTRHDPSPEKIGTVVARMAEIDDRLSRPIDRDTLVKLSRERAELEPVHRRDGRRCRRRRPSATGSTRMLADPEMAGARRGGAARGSTSASPS